MQTDDDKQAKEARAAMFRKPAAPVYTEAQRALQRRIRRAENKADIDAANKERAMLGDLERQCVAFGEQPLNLAPVVFEDMPIAELRSYREMLRRLWTECRACLAWHLEERAEAESQQAATAAPIGALGSLLSSASSVGANYAKYQSGANPNVSGYAAGTGLAGSSWSFG